MSVIIEAKPRGNQVVLRMTCTSCNAYFQGAGTPGQTIVYKTFEEWKIEFLSAHNLCDPDQEIDIMTGKPVRYGWDG